MRLTGRLKRVLRPRFVFIGLVLFGLVLASGYFIQCLPEPLFDKPVSKILLSRDGRLLGARIAADEQWRFPALDSVPEKFAKSLITFEDKRFKQHIGVDFFALARAIRQNISAGRIVSGASTISMQVIRLAKQNHNRSILNKLAESLQAIRLETIADKNEILALYASHAPFGGNVVGLEAAAWRYFSTSPEQLSWAESALLAVLPNSPALIHPGRNRKALKSKRDRLLNKLYRRGVLNRLDLELALAESLPEEPRPLPALASHLLDSMTLGRFDFLDSRDSRSGSEEVKTKSSAANRFHSTLDHELQSQIRRIATQHSKTLALEGIHNLALLVIDNRDNSVRAYLGNAPGEISKNSGRAIDIMHRPRSTGSTLKPFLFAAMLENGDLTPETLIPDVPVYYNGYRPENFTRKFNGAVRARQALASSLNVPAVNMLSQYGVERFAGLLRQLGMTTLKRESREYGLPLVLGGAEGTLWELTALYANLARLASGQFAHAEDALNMAPFAPGLQPAVMLQDKKQLAASTQTVRPERIEYPISRASAWMTLQALLDVTRPGNAGYWKRFNSSHKIAWKTGTSFGHRDAWAIGTSPAYTVGVWVGNAAGEGRQGMTGVKVAAPLLFDIFNRLDAERKTTWFEKPLAQMKKVKICKADGYLAHNGCESVDYLIPQNSHFEQVSPHHHRVHLDKKSGLRVHSRCESPFNMVHQSWFELPPAQQYYYQLHNADYRSVPKWRVDCLPRVSLKVTSRSPISLIYPQENAELYIPRQLDGKPGRTVFRAVHKKSDARLFWHLDDNYIGSTQTFHEKGVYASEGRHRLTLLDETGNQVESEFRILSR